jgi:hypothetical protein
MLNFERRNSFRPDRDEWPVNGGVKVLYMGLSGAYLNLPRYESVEWERVGFPCPVRRKKDGTFEGPHPARYAIQGNLKNAVLTLRVAGCFAIGPGTDHSEVKPGEHDEVRCPPASAPRPARASLH